MRKPNIDIIKRDAKFLWQRVTRGWDDSVTWSLDTEIARFVLPRLKRFREITKCYPPDLTPEEWNGILDEMIWAFDIAAHMRDLDPRDSKRYARAKKLFAKYFDHLWW